MRYDCLTLPVEIAKKRSTLFSAVNEARADPIVPFTALDAGAIDPGVETQIRCRFASQPQDWEMEGTWEAQTLVGLSPASNPKDSVRLGPGIRGPCGETRGEGHRRFCSSLKFIFPGSVSAFLIDDMTRGSVFCRTW